MNTPSLRTALAEARRLGCLVEHVRRTGEIRVCHGGDAVVVNHRRKDASKRLLVLLRRAREGLRQREFHLR